MQIGPARFSPQALTLSFADGRELALSAAQGALLLMLGSERGRVVSRSSLLSALKRVGVAEPRLDSEMRSLGALMGKDWPRLLEVVGDQGFILHARPRPGRSLFGRPLGEMSKPLFLGLMLLIGAALALMLLAMPSRVTPPFSKLERLTVANGQQVELRRFGEPHALIGELTSVLEGCKPADWSVITVSVATQGELMHLVLEQPGAPPRNLKLLGSQEAMLALDMNALKEAGVCD
ncbi:helix-turn-helix domain-containing protein [Shewanella khirikhana]|uniref:OmpR/PhoB-type domain-containing protein n=1 Tax=Shewanella khirikhana TaxID=1965282 RepID=A0ABN5TYM5_9GAMM|nr:helix-turn-helix domain-containing protein [Shewanella khirikhana]AZQ11695.1 hypothetical protein STH12_02626 [Shewanella khirikhana]